MQDRFSFRAWLIDYKMLVDVASLNWLGEIEAQLSEDDDFSKFSPNEYILMQCTGLKDKNGKLIYEGDIYHMGDPNIMYVVMRYDTGFMGKQVGSFGSYAGLSAHEKFNEIIGNIQEHKELLEGRE